MTLLLSVLADSPRARLECPSSTSSSVTLTWTAPGDDGSVGLASLYNIRYALFEINEENWSLATPAIDIPLPQAAGQQDSFLVNNLNENNMYYFAIKAADEIPNWSFLSPVVSRRTLSSAATVAPERIVDLEVSASTSNSLTLNWTAPADASGGAAFLYSIQFSHDSITTANQSLTTAATEIPSPGEVGSFESFTLTNLEPMETYYFTIRSCNLDFTWSELSNIVASSTLASGAPDDIVYAYPNPFRPAAASAVTFANIPPDTDLLICSTSGDVVMRWSNNTGEDILWYGTNQSGHAVASGVYLWYILGTEMNGKVIVRR